jgi:hypothetical protein
MNNDQLSISNQQFQNPRIFSGLRSMNRLDAMRHAINNLEESIEQG